MLNTFCGDIVDFKSVFLIDFWFVVCQDLHCKLLLANSLEIFYSNITIHYRKGGNEMSKRIIKYRFTEAKFRDPLVMAKRALGASLLMETSLQLAVTCPSAGALLFTLTNIVLPSRENCIIFFIMFNI